MNLATEIQKQIDRGFTKKQMENLLKLPKNSLSSFLSGKRIISRVSNLRAEKLIVKVSELDPFDDVLFPKVPKKRTFKYKKKVSVNNLTNNHNDTNKTIDTTGRIDGESILDYKIRISEQNENK